MLRDFKKEKEIPTETVGLAAFFVQAHFAGADNAVDMAFGYAFEDFYQIVVKALSGFVFGDGNQAD